MRRVLVCTSDGSKGRDGLVWVRTEMEILVALRPAHQAEALLQTLARSRPQIAFVAAPVAAGRKASSIITVVVTMCTQLCLPPITLQRYLLAQTLLLLTKLEDRQRHNKVRRSKSDRGDRCSRDLGELYTLLMSMDRQARVEVLVMHAVIQHLVWTAFPRAVNFAAQ
eukprot:3853462-Amphidinium_carterae.1